MMHLRAIRATVVLVLVCSAVALIGVRTTSTARAAGRALTVTPATELGHQVALAHWSGFNPINGVIVQQCRANPVTLADCETALPFPNSENGNEVIDAVTQTDSTGEAFIEVRPAAQLPALDCSADSPCSLVAYENDGQIIPPTRLPLTAVTAPIAFAASAADCPPVTDFDVRAEGEASSAEAFYRWIAGLCNADPKLVVDYTETSSVAGREDFLASEVDIGVTSTAATTDELATPHPEFTYAPVDLTAVVVVYNMTNPTTGKRITDLTLSPRLLTRVITDTGLLDFFNDPELNRLNPGPDWPYNGLSVPLIRAERNADTFITTSWMVSDANARKFLADEDPDHVAIQPAFKDYAYPTDVFENVDSNTAYVPRQGQNEVGRRVFYGATPTGASAVNTSQYGFIGLVDLPTAERYNLPVAKLVNASGNAVAPDDESILAGYEAMKTGPDGITKFPDFATPDADAYPLVKVDYAMVPTNVSATLAADLKRFLTFVATTGQEEAPEGFVAMPADLVARTNAAVGAIKAHTGTTPPPITPTTTPTTTPIATPPVDLGPIDGGGFDTGSDEANPPSATTVAPKSTKRAAGAPAKLAQPKPVVNVAEAAERFGLPVIAGLALFAGLYPLKRKIGPIIGRGFTALKRRLSRSAPAVEPTS